MKKKISLLTGLIISSLLFSCGGGGGSNGNVSSRTSVSGNVEASKVKGMKICENNCNSNNCVESDENGTFKITVGKLPATLKACIGDLPLGTINATSTVVSVNPLTLADGNETVAQEIGALIHAVAGDINGTATNIDLSKVDRIEVDNQDCDNDIVDCLKNEGNLTITVEINENGEIKQHKVEAENGTVKCDNSTVKYNIHEKDKLWKLEEFVSKSNGKTVNFPDGSSCKLQANPNDISEFKLINCTNPSKNDTNWEKMFLTEEGEVAVRDEDGNVWIIQHVEPDEGIVCYYPEDNQTEVSCITLNESGHHKNNTYRDFLTLLGMANGKKVKFMDSEDGDVICTLAVHPDKPNKFMFFNCTNGDWNDSGWEIAIQKDDKVLIKDKVGDKYVIDSEITAVNLANKTFSGFAIDENTNATAIVLDTEFSPIVTLLYDFTDWLKKNNNERIVFYSENGTSLGSCNLQVKPDDSTKFKFVDCTNHDDNDETWERVVIINNKIAAIDEDNTTTFITRVDLNNNTAYWFDLEENATGYMKPE